MLDGGILESMVSHSVRRCLAETCDAVMTQTVQQNGRE
jgi:hypothetical protein